MSDQFQTKPIMDGADDASDEEKTAGLAEQVRHDPSGDPSATRSDQLHERMDEADVDPAERARD